MFDSCKITYTKLNQDSTIVINEKVISNFVKKDGCQWGPEIQNLFFRCNSPNMIHLCWQLNDGKNYFIYYYAIINTYKEDIILKEVGVKYPKST
jgi:hypothetical protein